MSTVTNQLFDTNNVLVFRIPPGSVLVSKWDTKGSNVVWRGGLRLIEEEEIIEDESKDKREAYQLLRLKIHLYNEGGSKLLLRDSQDSEQDEIWAEAWYNPFRELGIECSIANDGGEAIEMSDESLKFYKIVVQLPGSGYHPFPLNKSSTKRSVLQVALGLKFENSFDATSFSESLGIYKRRFKAFQEKQLYDKHLSTLQQRVLNNLTIEDKELRENTPASDDDDFGNFVGSSYD